MKQPKPIPLAYIITCRTYASWLHGDPRGSVDRKRNKILQPKIKHNPGLHHAMKAACKESEFVMNAQQRQVVLHSIIDTCQHSTWYLHAAHVRSNHIHVVLTAEKPPERIVMSLKANATRLLRIADPTLTRERFWSRGASTRYIFQSIYIFRAIEYTINEQGCEMARYCDPKHYESPEYLEWCS